MTARLHLLCSASSLSVRSIAFPTDEPLDNQGRESLARLAGKLPACDIALRSPALCAEQTAEGLMLEAKVEPQIRECDFGRWAGRSLAEVKEREPDALADWLQNPRTAPHGGESFADLMTRIGRWMDGLLAGGGSILAITHASVIRAAITHVLRAGPEAFRHIDVAPLARTKLSGGGGRWTLVAHISPKDLR